MTGQLSIGAGRSNYAGRRVYYFLFPYDDDVMAILKATGMARWSGSKKYGWMLPATVASATVVGRVLVETIELIEWQISEEAQAAIEASIRATDARTAPIDTIPEYESRHEPMMHQRRGFHIINTCEAWYLDWGMGSGKTKAVVDVLNHNEEIQTALVGCPPSVVDVWGSEFVKHAIGAGWNIDGLPPTSGRPIGTVYLLLDGSVGARVIRMNRGLEAQEKRGGKFVAVMNYQAMWQKAMKARLLDLFWDLVVCDEAQCIKAPGGVTSKFMSKLRDVAKRRGCLSGTPMPHGPGDIYGQFRFLDPGIFGESYTRFKTLYPFDGTVILDIDAVGFTVRGDFVYTKRCADIAISGRYWKKDCWWFPMKIGSAVSLCGAFSDIPVSMSEGFMRACDNVKSSAYKDLVVVDRQRMEEDFKGKLALLMDRVVTADVIDLPELTDQFISVRLGREAAKAYRDLKKHLVAEVKGGTFTAANALARIIRCQQITSGCIPVKMDDENPLSDDVEWVWVDDAKKQGLKEVLESIPQQESVVVFGRFLTDLKAVQDVATELDRPSCVLRGGVNEIGPKWSNDPSTVGGRATVAAVQIQAGGIGIDLTKARYAIFYSLSYSNGEFRQAMARVYRKGQDRTTHIIHIVAKGTIDERIYEALQAKEDVVTHILGSLQKEK